MFQRMNVDTFIMKCSLQMILSLTVLFSATVSAKSLGLSLSENLTVVSVDQDSPAEKSRLVPGLILKRINNREVTSAKDVLSILGKAAQTGKFIPIQAVNPKTNRLSFHALDMSNNPDVRLGALFSSTPRQQTIKPPQSQSANVSSRKLERFNSYPRSNTLTTQNSSASQSTGGDWKGWHFSCAAYESGAIGQQTHTKVWAQRKLVMDHVYVLTLDIFESYECVNPTRVFGMTTKCESMKSTPGAIIDLHYKGDYRRLYPEHPDYKLMYLYLMPAQSALIEGYITELDAFHNPKNRSMDPPMDEITYSNVVDLKDPSMHGSNTFKQGEAFSGTLQEPGYRNRPSLYQLLLDFDYTTIVKLDRKPNAKDVPQHRIDWIDRYSLRDLKSIRQAYDDFCDLEYFNE